MKEICGSSLSEKRWLLRDYEETHALAFMQKLEVSPTLARLLAMRGHDLEGAPLFLEPSLRQHLPDPLSLKDMDKAIERLFKAITLREKILVWGDYDVDGATSSALFCRFFKALNVPIALYIPDRQKEGYGPNIPGIKKFISQGYTVMITVDCGTTSFEALEAAEGMDVLILDHHAPEVKLPPAHAIVNPNRLDENEHVTQSLGHLAAVGVSFLCIVALNRTLRNAGFYKTQQEPNLMDFLDLVALGTVCDVMPLTGLNRTFVAQGLKVMAARKNLGLRALSDSAGIEEIPTPYHLGFVIGPRINAGGRVGESFLGARLLSTESSEEAFEISQKLNAYNQERRLLESEALDQAFLQAQPESSAIIVDHKGWHEGIIGIVAGRLKEKFHKPTAVITWTSEGVGKGSARSIYGFDFGRFIHKAHHLGYVLGGGGHAMAAGFSLTKEQLPLFTNFLLRELERLGDDVDLRPTLFCDGYLDLRSLTPSLLQEMETLAPFGIGNSTPKFIFSAVMVDSYQLIQDQHIRCRFSQGDGVVVEGMGFRLKGSSLGTMLMDGSRRPLDLLASAKLNTWGGKTKINLMIEDATPALLPLRKAG
ncbi:MAG: single-stranded-DNA-specific exonuclease RecJ [Alphaproteobacteria bacterium]|jgi:single-stranded-DNA-specific exonuclease|nr:single-stranded-DNA-specific exonuclease RecJ [Alphaproteobacteria bacterium]MBP7729279.1 single-stranded-DNA-specific exonuclease RecJ [Alphaproteobacteria bacterium]